MVTLGVLYAIGVVLVMGASALVDGGRFAQLYVQGGGITQELVMDPQFRMAMWLSTLLYLPVSLAFWHAPALVHWHGVAPVKSLFFSLVAVLKNTRAFLLYGALWMVLSFAAGLVLLKVKLETVGEDFFRGLNLRQTPTLSLFKDGTEAARLPGFQAPPQIAQAVATHFAATEA